MKADSSSFEHKNKSRALINQLTLLTSEHLNTALLAKVKHILTTMLDSKTRHFSVDYLIIHRIIESIVTTNVLHFYITFNICH